MSELIKELRERTGAGFVDCKKALEASNNDIDKAIEWLQKNGAAKAVKKAGNIAAEGLVNIAQNDQQAIIYEVNSQTDFVARNEDFKKLVQEIGTILLNNKFTNGANALEMKSPEGKSIEELTAQATAVIGEKISFRRAFSVEIKDGVSVGTYVHHDGSKAAIFAAKSNENKAIDSEKLKGIAMHITAMDPQYINEQSVPAQKLEELKAEFAQSPKLAGKPENIQQNIMAGMLKKELSNYTLTEQEYVLESGKTVGKYLQELNASEIEMVRFQVGEGIEKQEVDFAAEVAAQMKK